jgi:hypothetical protein
VLGHDPSYVYVDGELKTLVLPGKTVRIRMTGDTSHLVNFCAYSKQWNCSTPTSMNFASADATLVIYPPANDGGRRLGLPRRGASAGFLCLKARRSPGRA